MNNESSEIDETFNVSVEVHESIHTAKQKTKHGLDHPDPPPKPKNE